MTPTNVRRFTRTYSAGISNAVVVVGAPGMDYREFSTDGGPAPAGGLYQINPEWFGGNPPPPHYMIYVAVDDVDANAEKAKALGANIHKIVDIPNVGRMAIIQDPTGAMFATFKMGN